MMGLPSHREGDYCQLYLSMLRPNSSFPSFPCLSSLSLLLLPTAVWPWVCGKLILGSLTYDHPLFSKISGCFILLVSLSRLCPLTALQDRAGNEVGPFSTASPGQRGFTISATLPIAFEDVESWAFVLWICKTANLSFTLPHGFLFEWGCVFAFPSHHWSMCFLIPFYCITICPFQPYSYPVAPLWYSLVLTLLINYSF